MTKVLIVGRHKAGYEGNVAPFIREQLLALRRQGVECECFLVRGSGVTGYLKQRKALKKNIASFNPELIHAHYGLCGWLANLQRKVPVVTTYHGSDINNPKSRLFSRQAMRLSKWNIFVSQKTIDIARPRRRYSLIPCGVDLVDLQLTGKREARQRMGLDQEGRYVLFAGGFDNAVKDASLAQEAVSGMDVRLLELKGYTREEVTLLMCAADALLMTSKNEGSPQVIKEAMACGCPIVSVDVGDVKERVEGVAGCYVAQTRAAKELEELLKRALCFEGKTKGRESIISDGLENSYVAKQLQGIYQTIIKK